MVEGLIGRKVGMTQVFDAEGNAVPATIIKAGPCTVIQKKTRERDGYVALQLGFIEEQSVKRPTKAQIGHFKKSGIPVVKKLVEVGFSESMEISEGEQVFVDIFEVGETVHISGTSKGKGFAGVVKRHHFKGGDAGHGSMHHRAPGSIGASSYPSRVMKGMRMAGQMGHARVTMRNLVVVETDRDNNLLVVRGAVPGSNGGYILIRKRKFEAAGSK